MSVPLDVDEASGVTKKVSRSGQFDSKPDWRGLQLVGYGRSPSRFASPSGSLTDNRWYGSGYRLGRMAGHFMFGNVPPSAGPIPRRLVAEPGNTSLQASIARPPGIPARTRSRAVTDQSAIVGFQSSVAWDHTAKLVNITDQVTAVRSQRQGLDRASGVRRIDPLLAVTTTASLQMAQPSERTLGGLIDLFRFIQEAALPLLNWLASSWTGTLVLAKVSVIITFGLTAWELTNRFKEVRHTGMPHAGATIELLSSAVMAGCTLFGPVVSTPWSVAFLGVSVMAPLATKWLLESQFV